MWEPSVDLYIDAARFGGAFPILDGRGSSPGIAPTFIRGDIIPLRIYIRSAGAVGAASEAVELPEGATLVFAAKLKSALGGDTLFYAADFEVIGAGDDLCYEATLDLDGDDLETAFANEASIAVAIDIEIEADGVRKTYRFDTTVYEQVYYTGEATPTPVPSATRGTVDLVADQDYIEIVDLDLDRDPAQVFVCVRHPATGALLIAAVREDSIDRDGFIVDFSANVPAAGYKLDYRILYA